LRGSSDMTLRSMVIPSTMSQRSDRVIYINEPPLNFNTARDDAGAPVAVLFLDDDAVKKTDAAQEH